MAGRPTLRIGQHGKIKRVPVDPGVWIARCRYRDTDGVTRIVERRSPTPGKDQWGKQAEDELLSSLTTRRPPSVTDEVTGASKIVDLIKIHIDRLEEDGKAGSTIETYRANSAKVAKIIGGLRVSEATTPRIDAALRSMRTAHGIGQAKHAKGLLRGGLQLAVMAGVIPTNPTRDVSSIGQSSGKGAPALAATQVATLLAQLQTSGRCQRFDLAGPITMLMATGLRRAELLGLRWSDYDRKAGTIAVKGQVVRVKGKGLNWKAKPKTKSGFRTLGLPQFAIDMLEERRHTPYVGDQTMIFPSTAGTWRDPNNFGRDWRLARDELGLSEVTSHSFRKMVATAIDDAGLSARIGADHLGHAKVSMTQDVYMARGRMHSEVAEVLELLAAPPQTTDK